jgi:hypothetical protein
MKNPHFLTTGYRFLTTDFDSPQYTKRDFPMQSLGEPIGGRKKKGTSTTGEQSEPLASDSLILVGRCCMFVRKAINPLMASSH